MRRKLNESERVIYARNIDIAQQMEEQIHRERSALHKQQEPLRNRLIAAKQENLKLITGIGMGEYFRFQNKKPICKVVGMSDVSLHWLYQRMQGNGQWSRTLVLHCSSDLEIVSGAEAAAK